MSHMSGYEMNCDGFADHLADYLEGDAPERVRRAVEAHAATCEACGALLAEVRQISQSAAALPLLSPGRDLWSGIADRIDARVLPLDAPIARRGRIAWRPWMRPAVAAAALVIFTASVTHVLTRASLAPTRIASLPIAQPASSATPRAVDTVYTSAPAASAPTAEFTSTATEHVATTREPSPRSESRVTSNPTSRAPAATVRLVSAAPLLQETEPVYDREIGTLRRIVRDRHSQLDPATIAVLEQSVAVIDSAIAQSRAALAKDPASGFLATQLNYSLEKKVELLRTAALLPART